nr:MAG TPA: tail connector protein [Bacteriophage sp.]
MASIPIKEPYVKVSEQIMSKPNLLDVDGTTNIGVVIVAPAGPRLAYVDGPKTFLKLYTVDGNIPRNAHISFVNAYYLSFVAGLVVVRSMNTTSVSGLFFEHEEKNESKLFINTDNSSLWGMSFNDKYYFCNNGNESFEDFLNVVKNLTNDNGDPVYNATALGKIKTAGTGKSVACKNFDELAEKLQSALTTSQSKQYTVIYSQKMGGLVFSPDIDTILTIDATLKESLVGLKLDIKHNKTGISSLKSTPIKYKDGVALTESEDLEFTFTDGIDGNWAFVYGSMAYYHGAVDKSIYEDYSLVPCKSMDDIITSISGIKGMTCNEVTPGTKIKVTYSKGNRIYVASAASGLNVGVTVKQPEDATSVDMSGMLFGIYPNDPQGSDVYKLIVQPSDGNLFVLSLTDVKSTKSYVVSLLPDELDASGNNAFIENLNALGTGFTIVTNPNYDENNLRAHTPKSTQVFSFGNSGLDLSSSKKVNCMIQASYVLEDQNEYDIAYMSSAGVTDLQYVNVYTLVGKNKNCLTPVDIPYDKTNVNSIKGYFLNIKNSDNIIAMGPFDKNTGLTGWLNYIAASTLYWERVMTNKAKRCEFAPAFAQTNGVLNYTNPVYLLGKEDTEKLLNFRCPVNFVKFNQKTNSYYLNLNATHKPEKDVLSEEQNRRMVNKINRDCNQLMQRFIGRVNTISTRQEVETLLRSYFETNIQSQIYKLDDYNVVCDRSDINTIDMINANKLGVLVQVKLTNAIYYIDVLNQIYSIGTDFNS